MTQSLGLVSLLVREYDEAIDFYVGKLGFTLVEDVPIPEQNKRWVVVAPPSSRETRLLLARAANTEQAARIGNQTGGRVFLFLYTDDLARDYQNYKARGIVFARAPEEMAYGTVAVFEDLYGNRWDLLQLRLAKGDAPEKSAARSILESSRLPDAIKYVGWCLLLLLPTSFVGKGLNWALMIGNAWVALAIVGFAAVLLLLFAALMTNEQFLRDVSLQGTRWPSVLSITLGWLAVVVFGGLSCGFERIGIVELQPSVPLAEGCATRYADFYLWHLFDSIPGIKFNETVGWTQRYAYSDKLSGWLLLAFKVLVIVSVIGSFVVTGRLRRENKTAVSSKGGRSI